MHFNLSNTDTRRVCFFLVSTMGGTSPTSILLQVKQKVKDFILLCASSRPLTMAEAHSYPLLVGFVETNIPSLETKLLQYFRTVGGDCEIEYENGSRTAKLHFTREEGKFGSMK